MPTRLQIENAKNLPLTEVLTLYKEGKSTRQIALIFGVSFSTIQKRVQALNSMRSPFEANLMRFHKRTAWLISYDEVVRLYNEGKSSTEIASLAGISPNRVTAYLKKRGVLRSKSEAMKLAFRQGKLKRASGSEHYKWKGGLENRRGYIFVAIGKGKRVRRSRIVWEKYHNQALPEGWVIHHLNGIKDDDRPENLLAIPKKHHVPSIHPKDLLIKELQKRIRELEGENQALRS